MGLFGEVKCGRCDRRYSAARSRCPYCGARKSRSGRRVDTTDGNSRLKLIAGLIILLLIIIAVVVVILISVNSKDTPPADNSPSSQVSDSGVSSVDNTPLPSETPSETPSEEPSPSAPTVVDIILNREDFTLASIGESWSLEPQLVPEGIEADITWTSSDENVAIVDLYGKVTAIGNGYCDVTATSGDVSVTCIVRVSAG